LEDYQPEHHQVRQEEENEDKPHYNDVQVKYWLCNHLPQSTGGRWKNVFLDIGYMTEEMLGEKFYRWFVYGDDSCD
jgi:exodeoxyribonuclease-5